MLGEYRMLNWEKETVRRERTDGLGLEGMGPGTAKVQAYHPFNSVPIDAFLRWPAARSRLL